MGGILVFLILGWACMFFVGMVSTWLILAVVRLLCRGFVWVIKRSLSIAS